MPTALVRIGSITYTRKAYVDRFGHKHKAKKVTRKGYEKKVRRSKKRRTPKGKRWYRPRVKMNWSKSMPQEERRENALDAHGSDLLATARALLALSNVTQDRETKVEARKDADYFFAQHEKEK